MDRLEKNMKEHFGLWLAGLVVVLAAVFIAGYNDAGGIFTDPVNNLQAQTTH